VQVIAVLLVQGHTDVVEHVQPERVETHGGSTAVEDRVQVLKEENVLRMLGLEQSVVDILHGLLERVPIQVLVPHFDSVEKLLQFVDVQLVGSLAQLLDALLTAFEEWDDGLRFEHVRVHVLGLGQLQVALMRLQHAALEHELPRVDFSLLVGDGNVLPDRPVFNRGELLHFVRNNLDQGAFLYRRHAALEVSHDLHHTVGQTLEGRNQSLVLHLTVDRNEHRLVHQTVDHCADGQLEFD